MILSGLWNITIKVRSFWVERDLLVTILFQPSIHFMKELKNAVMTSTLTDEELMLQVRDNVNESLAVLFDRYHLALFNFYFKLSGSRANSEDLVQEVFLRILKYRRSYRPGMPFRAWIYQVARNARRDDCRKKLNEVGKEMLDAPAYLPTDTAERKQEADYLYHALWQMKQDNRELLVLSRFQELSYEEIGLLLGCSVGAVKVRVHRAIQELREIVQKSKALRASGMEYKKISDVQFRVSNEV